MPEVEGPGAEGPDPLERAALCRFLARLFLPPGEETLSLAAELSALAATLEPLADLRQRHTWLFDFNVYPYASVFLDPSGGLNAPWSGFVAGIYRALGLELEPDANLAAPDHVSAELEALAALLEREGDAADEAAAWCARHAQRTLLLEQLLPWAPAFTCALRRVAGESFYGVVADLTRDALLGHANALLGSEAAPAFGFPEPAEEVRPFSLSDKGGGKARASLQALITPARSGFFLSREDLTRLGRELGLPVRFAERAFMLEALVQAAAEMEKSAALFAALRREARAQAGAMESWGRAHPGLAPIWEAWLERLEATEGQLASLATSS